MRRRHKAPHAPARERARHLAASVPRTSGGTAEPENGAPAEPHVQKLAAVSEEITVGIAFRICR